MIPSSALKTITYFLKSCQTGKKKRTSRALGKKIPNAPMVQPKTWYIIPLSFNAIPPVKEAIEKTGPGIALTKPAPVNNSLFSNLIKPCLASWNFSAVGLATYWSTIKGIKTSDPPKTILPNL